MLINPPPLPIFFFFFSSVGVPFQRDEFSFDSGSFFALVPVVMAAALLIFFFFFPSFLFFDS